MTTEELIGRVLHAKVVAEKEMQETASYFEQEVGIQMGRAEAFTEVLEWLA